MISHDRHEYRQTMGHSHLGFSKEELISFTQPHGFQLDTYHILPPDPQASGPLLFIATFFLD